jgi:hypothetical protein
MIGSINRPKTRSNASSVRRVMKSEPISDPTMISTSTGADRDKTRTPSFRNAAAKEGSLR